MGSRKVTKRAVDALQCPPGKDREFLWDDELRGFGVAAMASGRKFYVIQFRQKGRSRRMTIGEHGRLTPDEARSAAKKLLGAVEHGTDPIAQRRGDRASKTFSGVWDEYYRLQVLPKRKPRTAEEYNRLAALHLLPTLGPRLMADIRKVDVTRLHAKMSVKPGAANRALALLSAVWNWAEQRDEAPNHSNPTRGIERFPEKSRERYLSIQELGQLGDALRRAESEGLPWVIDAPKATAKHVPKKRRLTKLDPGAIGAVRLLILTGARLREILGAKWEYVDWDRGLMHLPDSKTGKKTIYLSAPALAVLQGLRRLSGSPYIVPGLTRAKSEGAKSKKPVMKPRADLKKPWAAVARAAGLQGVRLHDLRHSFAATGAGASLGLPMIGKLLGHSQPATTARYAHLDADPMRRAADMIGNQIAAAMDGRSGTVVPLADRSGTQSKDRRKSR